jgi:stage V sporulation protein K
MNKSTDDKYKSYGNKDGLPKDLVNEPKQVTGDTHNILESESDGSGIKDKFGSYTVPELKPAIEEATDHSTPTKQTQPLHKADLLVEEVTQQKNLDTLLEELEGLIGLARVKSEVKALLQFAKVQDLRHKQGISDIKPSFHCVFYGSPGTGKTTVARIYGQILSAMGFLSKGHLVETDRSGLVGGYIGQTAIKTENKVKEALGGVLFIDEAYSLSKGDLSDQDYGHEAIEVLVKRMEDFRNDFVVIVAGYPEPMKEFLVSNEGLKSRFSTYIHFDDYSPDEMVQIFLNLCSNDNYSPNDEAIEYVRSAMSFNHMNKDKSFGNGRFVRNFFEIVIKNQACRIGIKEASPTIDELKMIFPEDVPLMSSSDI